MTKYTQFKKISKSWKLLVASDIVVFSFQEKVLKVLLVKRKFDPNAGQWAIPGGFVQENESLKDCALRELKEETGIHKNIYLEQLYSFGEVKRDPRARVISIAYLLLIGNSEKLKLQAKDDASEVDWFEYKKLPTLAFGKSHQEILDYARKRLVWKLEYTNVGLNLLPAKFTLTELQRLYETVYNKKIDKRNFRKKVLSLVDFIEPIDELKPERGRPAQLYKKAKSKVIIYPRIF